MIDIQKTVDSILATKDVQFKVLATDQKTNAVTLATPVDDNFNRGIIVVEHQRIGIGTQGPDEAGKLTTLFQPATLELIENIVYVPEEKAEEKVEKPVTLAKEETKDAKPPSS